VLTDNCFERIVHVIKFLMLVQRQLPMNPISVEAY